MPKYDGRANRTGRSRQPRRPCAGSGSAKNCAPALDGAAGRRGGTLNRRISIPARSASLRAAGAVAEAANGYALPEVRCVPGQRLAQRKARKEKQRQMQFCTPSARRTIYAAPGSFKRRGRAQGRRGHGCPAGPIRTTPVPANPCAEGARFGTQRLFFWTVHGPFSFRQDEKKMGGAVPREPPGLRKKNYSPPLRGI